MSPSLFQSTRLTYRGFRPSDFDEFFEAYNDPEVLDGGSPDHIKPATERVKEKMKVYSESWALYLVATETESDQFVGWVGLNFGRGRDGELGMLVKRSQWGKGYGTEMCAWVVQHAFKFLDAHRVSLSVYESNIRAISMYKKVGFVHEGAKRRSRFAHGRWEDVIKMGILDEEFFSKDKSA